MRILGKTGPVIWDCKRETRERHTRRNRYQASSYTVSRSSNL